MSIQSYRQRESIAEVGSVSTRKGEAATELVIGFTSSASV
jgi:hypothetical protein